ncbi:hypothetical protein L7F22_052591 [Adiantum nelumboides]|nr:hypothetical protein [Adiantum nelumboides]
MSIITFITKRPQALALFRNVCQYELVKPAKTKFGYLFLVLQRLVQSKDVLRCLVCSVEWSNWNGSRKSKATAMCDHILSNSFWDDAEAIKQAVSPLYFILRLFDHERATMSLVYHYMQRLGTCMTTCNALSRESIEEESILFSQDRDYFARPIALKEESKKQAVSWWEINGRLTPTLQRLALRTLSQECTSGAAERIWSICADIHTRKRNRDGNGEGVLQWKVKDIDASVIANLERGLARGEAIDITFIQQRSDEDLAYDFLREEQTRFRRVTRAQARALQLPTEPPTMDAGVGPSTRGRSTLARGGHRGRGGRATRSSLVMREMMPSDESASSSSSTHSEMDAASDSDFVSE